MLILLDVFRCGPASYCVLLHSSRTCDWKLCTWLSCISAAKNHRTIAEVGHILAQPFPGRNPMNRMRYLLSAAFALAFAFGNSATALAQNEITLLASGPAR